MGGAGGKDQVVEGELGAGAEGDLAGGDVDAHNLVHQDLGIPVLAQDGADGLGNVGRREDGEGDLVEERLKGVVVAAVYDGNVYRKVGQSVGGMDAGKAAAYDDDAGAGVERLFKRFGQFTQNVPSLSIYKMPVRARK